MASEPTKDTLEIGIFQPASRADFTKAPHPAYAPVQRTTSQLASRSAFTARLMSSSNLAPRVYVASAPILALRRAKPRATPSVPLRP